MVNLETGQDIVLHMSQRILNQLRLSPANVALICDSGAVTYAQLDRLSETVAAHLRSQGGWKERPVGILAPSGLTFAVALLGVWKVGGLAVPLQPHHPLAELEYLVRDTGLSLILCDQSCLALGDKLDASSIFPVKMEEGASLSKPVELDADLAALMIYTSGTTNRPKGVVTTFASLDAQIGCLLQAWEWSPADRVLDVLPLHHVHGLVNVLCCSLAAGACCELVDKFDAGLVWERMVAGEINVFMAVPTIYTKLIAHWENQSPAEREKLSKGAKRMRLMVSGSAALPQPVFDLWLRITGHQLLERYGMTEIGMALSNPLHGERKVRTVGRPLPGVTVSLRSADGSEIVEAGAAGEIYVRGANVFREYWRKPKETADAFSANGYFKTGDVAERDSDGYFRILGRSSQDILKCGGYKISALEIESVLLEHPSVREAAVVGVQDETWGERVAAVVVGDVTGEVLVPWLKERLAVYKIPTLWRCAPELPRNAMGKVIKGELKKLW